MTVRLLDADLPALTGSPGLAQGAYGDAGNLELVVPAADHGFWVFWFNADPVDHRRGAARGCWSGGVRAFAGHRVEAARITQVQAGPRFLEALALGDGLLHRVFWTPDDGFVTAGVIARDIVAATAVVESGPWLHVLAVDRAARLLHLQGDARAYPEVAWHAEPVLDGAGAVGLTDGLHAAVVVDGAVRRLHHDGAWRREQTGADGGTPALGGTPAPGGTPALGVTDLALAGADLVTIDGAGRAAVGGHGVPGVAPARAVAAARTSLGGGRLDVVLATTGGLVHVHGDATTWQPPGRIRSRVWAEPGTPVHRG